jgi:hypothetical protein
MLQLRLAAGAAVAAAGAHAAWVHAERAKAPTGRLRQFSPASQDELVAERLKTGDLLLLQRNCTLYTCAGAAVCAARQAWLAGFASARGGAGGGGGGGASFAPDQAAVVVVLRGVPHVLERTFSGAKLRRYDHRITAARSPEVLLRPLRGRLPRERERALEAWAAAVAGGSGGGDAGSSRVVGGARGPGEPPQQQQATPSAAAAASTPSAAAAGDGALTELLARLPLDASANASVALVADAYAVAGLLPPQTTAAGGGGDGGVGDGQQPQQLQQQQQQPHRHHHRLSMRDLLPPSHGGGAADGPLRQAFGRDVWVRALPR